MRHLLVTLVALACSVLSPGSGAGPRAQGGSEADQASPEQVLVWADREFARESYKSAEQLYRKVVAAQPGNTHASGRLALLLTWRGQYKEAIDLYRRTLAAEPGSLETRRGLATAYCWSENYPKAIALYDDLLKEKPDDEGLLLEKAQAEAWSGDLKAARQSLDGLLRRNPRELKGRVLMGQVRQWSGEPMEAERIFRAVVAEDHRNAAAEAGLCESLNTLGRNDEALVHCDKALAIDPKNRTALAGRARALQSQGRTTEAVDAVRQTLELYPDARDARRLGREIGGPLRPALHLFGTTIQDTDDNDLSTWGGTYTHFLKGRGYVGVTFTHAQTDAKIDLDLDPVRTTSATPVARYDTLRLIGGWHVSKHFSAYIEAGGERTRFPFPETPDPNVQFLNESGAGATTESVSHGAGSLTLEANAGDWFTLVASGSQDRLLGTTQAFMNDIGIRAATLTAIFRPHRLVKLRLTGQKARFTDDDSYDVDSGFHVTADGNVDNERTLVSAGASWRLPWRRPALFLSYNIRALSYEHSVDHGYFDPYHYMSHLAGFDVSDTIGDHFYWGGGADTGVQVIDRLGPRSENAADTHNRVFGYRLLAGVNIAEAVSVEGYYARSDSALQSAAGFKSTEGGVRVKIRFGGTYGPAAPARRAPGN